MDDSLCCSQGTFWIGLIEVRVEDKRPREIICHQMQKTNTPSNSKQCFRGSDMGSYNRLKSRGIISNRNTLVYQFLYEGVSWGTCHGVHDNKRRSREVTWDRSAGDTADLVHTLCRARLSLPHTLQTTPNVEVAAVLAGVL